MRAIAIFCALVTGAAGAGALYLVYFLYMPMRLEGALLLAIKYGGAPIFFGAVILERILKRLSFGLVPRALVVLPMAAGFCAVTTAYLIFRNGDEDTSQIVAHRALIVDKHIVMGERPAHHVTLESWIEKGKFEDFVISERDYRAVTPKATFGTIYTRGGSLGFEWVSGSGPFLADSALSGRVGASPRKAQSASQSASAKPTGLSVQGSASAGGRSSSVSSQ